MIKRTFDLDLLLKEMEPYLPLVGFDPPLWLGNVDNLAFTDGDHNLALFERDGRGVVFGHYFFNKARGKEALALCREVLKEVFEGDYDVQVIKGLTPITHLGARWMNKKLGFKSYGVLDTVTGHCEIVILTKPEWEAQQ